MIFSKRPPKRSRYGRSPGPYGSKYKPPVDDSQHRYKSSSEPALDSSRVRFWLDGPFPPGLTVDELSTQRRRRLSKESLRDNLKPNPGTFSRLKSEYKKNFKEYPLDVLIKAYQGTLMDNWLLRKFKSKRRKSSEIKLDGNLGEIGEVQSEQKKQYVAHVGAQRAELMRTNTNLHPEGEFLESESEVRSSYRAYDSAERAELIRHPSNLRMEGDMEITTEQQDQFGPKSVSDRPELLRRPTHIRISTEEMALNTENHDQFVQFLDAERSQPIIPAENLKMEGDIEFKPEYHREFVKFPTQRPIIVKHKDTLRPEGEIEINPEYYEEFRDHNSERPYFPRPRTHLQPEGDFESTTEKGENFLEFEANRPYFPRPKTNLAPEGQMDLTSEQKANFVEIPDASRANNARPATNLRPEGRIEADPEYRSSFLPHPRERPVVKKLPDELRRPSGSGFKEKVSENRRNYVRHENVLKSGTNHRPTTNLRMDGEFYGESEQKSNYIDHPEEEKNFSSRKLYNYDADHINFDGYTGKAFKVLSLSEGGPDNSTNRTVGNADAEGNRPSYRLQVNPADDNRYGGDKSFIVIPDANNNTLPQSNWTAKAGKSRRSEKWVPSWANDKK